MMTEETELRRRIHVDLTREEAHVLLDLIEPAMFRGSELANSIARAVGKALVKDEKRRNSR